MKRFFQLLINYEDFIATTSLVIFHILLTEGPSAILNNRDTKMVSGGLITTENSNCLTHLGRGLDYDMLNK